MTPSRPIALLLVAAALVAGCVTERGPEDATVFGHFDKTKKVKEKRVKPQPISAEAPSGPVTVTMPAGN